jgi:23S rRNA (adenine2503-C2)-methyltransferase
MIWDKTRCIPSSDENVFKYVFEKGDAVAEAVLYKYPTFEARTVVCCSTQSGCPVGCRFCGAGDSFVRSLTAEEIVSQTKHLFADKDIDASKVERMQIMFMSMGEPLLNQRELIPAIRWLHDLYPKAALLVSTIGPKGIDYRPFIELSKEVPTVGLQFSVHESNDEDRDKLIPFKAKMSLAEIEFIGGMWHQETGRKPFFNYCAHENNSSEGDAVRIRNNFEPEVWEATISVICERDESVAAANKRQRELAANFQKLLVEQGFSTRMFDPAGQDDIGGGCGQLWFVQDWMKKNPQLAKASIGRIFPAIHTPRLELAK